MKKSDIRLVSVAVLLLAFVSVGLGQMRVGKFGVGLAGTGYYFLQSNLKTPDPSGGGAVTLTYSVANHVSLRSLLGVGYLAGTQAASVLYPSGRSIETNIYHWNLSLAYDFVPNGRFNPFIYVGGGLLWFDPRDKNGAQLSGSGVPRFDTNVLGGIGFDVFFNEFWAMSLSAEGVTGFNSWLDGTKGNTNDSYGRVSLGLRYHFFDQKFITKMIDAFEQRGK
jgi:hypothetical protein